MPTTITFPALVCLQPWLCLYHQLNFLEEGSFRVSLFLVPSPAPPFQTWIKQHTFSVRLVISAGCRRQLESCVIRHWYTLALVRFLFVCVFFFAMLLCLCQRRRELVKDLLWIPFSNCNELVQVTRLPQGEACPSNAPSLGPFTHYPLGDPALPLHTVDGNPQPILGLW